MSHDGKTSTEIDALVEQIAASWRIDRSLNFDEYLQQVDESHRPALLRSLLAVDVKLRIKAGQDVRPNFYRDLGEEAFRLASQLLASDIRSDISAAQPDWGLPPDTATVSVGLVKRQLDAASQGVTDSMPENIGRYRIVRVLGSGGFGQVFLAEDDELRRQVAIKVPRTSSQNEFDIELYRTEAQNVAKLEHPHIVPVYDIGQTDEYACFIVSKLVDGRDLAACLQDPQHRPNLQQSVEIIRKIASALAYSHKRGLVHRDIKPQNILLDRQTGEPFLVDFGMALREENYGKGSDSSMTPAYMSPEQASGRGHRVDGRSDIFSLGVTLYELVTGQRPFKGDSVMDLATHIASDDHRPMRQLDETIPKELERIVTKTLEKKQTDRYSTAADLADDLEQFLKSIGEGPATQRSLQANALVESSDDTERFLRDDTDQSATQSDSVSESLHIVPKGLRSFDENDADFFLELLPGARDRHGVPDSIRFWKQKIEERDPDRTFPVGLIYGPSGCGKSSLAKAGLLPLLEKSVTPIYVEATPDQTESRLLKQIRKRCVDLIPQEGLESTLAFFRRQADSSCPKLLIVIDQFEQWLHSHRDFGKTDLVRALSQCNGGHVQCIVMVRDDFWMAATRFMRELEVRLLEAENSAAVDLFPIRHAEKVLVAFGRAFGVLDSETTALSKEQRQFVQQSVEGLAQDGKVICVRLALFAEMMRGRNWTPQALKEVGGTEGIGATFLEEKFAAKTAPPEHRYHQKAARAVLQALLPDSGSDIKGEMKSREELLALSGYDGRARDFEDLIQILDSELRLITPTDPEGIEFEEESSPEIKQGEQYYQLTHDYLVHSLSDWLTRKQRETRRGRAELTLAQRSVTWNAKPENRQLPSTLEWLRIHWLTKKITWTPPQKKMMQRANRVKTVFWSSVLAVMLLVGIGIQQTVYRIDRLTSQRNTVGAVNALQTTRGIAIPGALKDLDELPSDLVMTELQGRFPGSVGQQRLNLSYGLANFDQVEFEALIEGLLDSETDPDEVDNIVTALKNARSKALAEAKFKADEVSSNQNWIHKARLAMVALHLGDESLAAEMLRDSPDQAGEAFDPVERTVFIREFSAWSGAVGPLAKVLANSENPALRSGICLSLGSVKKPGAEAKEKWQPVLAKWFANSTDGGTHSAAGWALSRWNLDSPETEASKTPPADRDWWLEPNGLSFVKVDSGTVTGEKEPIVVGDDYWLSDSEITVGMFHQFMADEKYHLLHPDLKPDWDGPEIFAGYDLPDLPVQQVSWYDAVLFCNWLSWKLGLDQCYAISKSAESKRELYKVTWRREADGIRLPTSAEWEYACRASTTTRFSYGDDEQGPPDYGWFTVNSNSRTQRVGQKLCNAWGLFDMHGNVWEWCWSTIAGSDRVIRGGSWNSLARNCQSSYRSRFEPPARSSRLGFRVARGPSSPASPASE